MVYCSFRFPANLEESTEAFHILYSITVFPFINIPHESTTFVRSDETTLTHHHSHMESQLLSGLTPGVDSMGLCKSIMPYIHHVISHRIDFTALKFLCVLSIHPCNYVYLYQCL